VKASWPRPGVDRVGGAGIEVDVVYVEVDVVVDVTWTVASSRSVWWWPSGSVPSTAATLVVVAVMTAVQL
jgi:hypothetical protein